MSRLRMNSLSEKRQVLYASMWIWSSHFRARQTYLSLKIVHQYPPFSKVKVLSIILYLQQYGS